MTHKPTTFNYEGHVKDERLPPTEEKARENKRYTYILRNCKTMDTNTMAKGLKIGYSQVVQRIQKLRKMGFDIPSLRRSSIEPNWDVVRKVYNEVFPTDSKKK